MHALALSHIVFALFVFAIGIRTAFAVNFYGLPNPLGQGCDYLNCLLGRIYDFIFVLATPATLIMALVGGFQMMLSAGNPESFKKGRKTLIYAVIGFAVVLLAKGITSVIQSFLSG